MHATYWIKITSSTTPTVYVQYYNEFSRKVMKRDCSLLRCPQSLLWLLIPLNFELSCTCRCICTDNSRQVTVNCFDRGGGPVRGSISCINYHEPPEFVSALPYYVDSQSYGKSVFWNVSINLYAPMRCARFLFLYMPWCDLFMSGRHTIEYPDCARIRQAGAERPSAIIPPHVWAG